MAISTSCRVPTGFVVKHQRTLVHTTALTHSFWRHSTDIYIYAFYMMRWHFRPLSSYLLHCSSHYTFVGLVTHFAIGGGRWEATLLNTSHMDLYLSSLRRRFIFYSSLILPPDCGRPTTINPGRPLFLLWC